MGKKFAAALVPVVLAVFLILVDGCGAYNPNGTGSGSGSGSSPGAAQGFYDCNVQQGAPAMEALILPSDVFYGVLGTLAPSSFTPTALVAGQGASGTTTYTGNLTEFLPSGATSSSTVTATDVPNESISGTMTLSGVQAGFGGAFLPTSSYDYSTPASISTVAGVWTGELWDSSPVTLSIGNTGSIVTTSTGCQITGNVTTFSNNTINVFSITNLAFGSTCSSNANQTTSVAVAVVFLLPDGATSQLLISGTFGSTAATVFSAQR